MAIEPNQEKDDHCLSCGEQLRGNFCYKCGEKVIRPKHDYSFIEFIEQTIDGFSHFDSKFIKSFKYLLFKPGLLTKDYIAGKRIRFMRPIQIFIISSVLFYFFMPRTSSFYESCYELQESYRAAYFNPGNPIKYNINEKLRVLALKETGRNAPDSVTGKTISAIKLKVEDTAASISKTWLFIVVPVWGLFFYGLFYRQNNFYSPHLVFAMHIFSFFLITDMLALILLFNVLKFHVIKSTVHLLPLLFLILAYTIVAVKRFYNQTTANAIWKGTISFLVLLILLMFYRPFITIWALYLV